MLDKIFTIFLLALLIPAMAVSAIGNYTSSRSAGKQLEAFNLAGKYLAQVQADPSGYPAGFNQDITESNPTTVFEGRMVVTQSSFDPDLRQVEITISWDDNKRTRTIKRVKLIGAGG